MPSVPLDDLHLMLLSPDLFLLQAKSSSGQAPGPVQKKYLVRESLHFPSTITHQRVETRQNLIQQTRHSVSLTSGGWIRQAQLRAILIGDQSGPRQGYRQYQRFCVFSVMGMRGKRKTFPLPHTPGFELPSWHAALDALHVSLYGTQFPSTHSN